MEKYINEHGKECYRNVGLDSEFNSDLFHHTKWQPKEHGEYALAFHCDLGSLTILSRRTGYIGEPIDIETGFRDPTGKFWLASGCRDVRQSGVKTVGEAIEWIKKYANNCVGE